jgi:DNA-directed RNA polymerase subunit RPC12/RpoP
MIEFDGSFWRCPKCGRYNSRCVRYAMKNPRVTKCRECGYKVIIKIGHKEIVYDKLYLKDVKEKGK